MVFLKLRRMHLAVWLVQFIVSSSAGLSQSVPKDSGYTSPIETPFPSNNSVSLMNATDFSNSFDYQPPLGASAIPQCNGTEYGTNIDRGSCFDVWRNMRMDEERISWGHRSSSENFDVLLPYRWSSGKCFATPISPIKLACDTESANRKTPNWPQMMADALLILCMMKIIIATWRLFLRSGMRPRG